MENDIGFEKDARTKEEVVKTFIKMVRSFNSPRISRKPPTPSDVVRYWRSERDTRKNPFSILEEEQEFFINAIGEITGAHKLLIHDGISEGRRVRKDSDGELLSIDDISKLAKRYADYQTNLKSHAQVCQIAFIFGYGETMEEEFERVVKQ